MRRGRCLRCRKPWRSTVPHKTVSPAGYCYPLCEQCWKALSPEERLPYYESAMETAGQMEEWPMLRNNVLAGL